MFLVIDIGNTTVSSALIRGQSISQKRNVYLDASLSLTKNKDNVQKVLKSYKASFENNMQGRCLVCSVVPKWSGIFKTMIKKELNLQVCIVGEDVDVPIVNKYKNPKQVGQDRLVGALAVKELYGAPAIVVDFGTAITFDVISARGDYQGGMIVPGLRMSTESLFQRTALLPNVEDIEKPRHLIGQTTEESILSGLYHGYGAMCEGLIQRISRQVKGRPRIVLTGGYAPVMAKNIGYDVEVNVNLVFEGLKILSKSVL